MGYVHYAKNGNCWIVKYFCHFIQIHLQWMNLSKTQHLKEFFCLNSRRASTIVFQIKSQKVFHLGWKISLFMVMNLEWNEREHIHGPRFKVLWSCDYCVSIIQLWLPRFWFRGVCTLQIAKGYWIISLLV